MKFRYHSLPIALCLSIVILTNCCCSSEKKSFNFKGSWYFDIGQVKKLDKLLDTNFSEKWQKIPYISVTAEDECRVFNAVNFPYKVDTKNVFILPPSGSKNDFKTQYFEGFWQDSKFGAAVKFEILAENSIVMVGPSGAQHTRFERR